MFIKLAVILLVLQFSVCQEEYIEWELAVVIDNQIELLQSNGSIIETTAQRFNMLKALTYDNVREQFIVSDTDQSNDTIFTVQLTKETDVDIAPIIQDLPDDVQGLAVDPINDVLYWTDAINRTINYIPLNETFYESKVLFAFDDKYPHAITIDVCKRYIYWTNSQPKAPTIERAKLDGTGHEILVDTGIISPEGIAIDYTSERLYWADTRDGSIYGRIESTNLEGKEREIVFEGTHSKPFGLAVDKDAIYWTDTNNNALYRILKSKKNEPEKLIVFDERPMGLVTNNNNIKDLPDCRNLEAAIENYKEYEKEASDLKEDEDQISECFNSGELIGNYCKCKRGFTGKYCEKSICYNLCLNGDCYVSSLGKPQCLCEKGFFGDRCEKNKCDGHCLNGGECSIATRDSPRCRCSDDFVGDRCEYGIQVCDLYCRDRDNDLFSEEYELLCRCNEGFNMFSERNHTAAPLSASQEKTSFLNMLSDPLYYFIALLSLCLLVIIALIVYIRTIRKRRPRIKKRIIVNKNVTPLTYRPQSSPDQCNITIECCNMNVCETPCFEPRGFQEDKKKLLTNMEGEDLY